MKRTKVIKPYFSAGGCTTCWACVEACPREAIHKVTFLWNRPIILHGRCVGCQKCVAVCPNGCIKVPHQN